MIVAIRISGQVNLSSDIKEMLFRLRLRRKYTAVLLHNTQENMKILKRLRNCISYGEISHNTLVALIENRGQPINKSKKIDAEKIAEYLSKKSLHELDLKPFFRLHPPRGGIDSKKHVGVSKNAVLGDLGEKINQLIERML